MKPEKIPITYTLAHRVDDVQKEEKKLEQNTHRISRIVVFPDAFLIGKTPILNFGTFFFRRVLFLTISIRALFFLLAFPFKNIRSSPLK